MSKNDPLTDLARQLVEGTVSPDAFRAEVTRLAAANASNVTVDHDRARRCGFPEVVFGEGKDVVTLLAIARELMAAGTNVFVTRVAADKAEAFAQELPDVRYNEVARTLRLDVERSTVADTVGYVPVISAGSSDQAVAEEARETLGWMNVRTAAINDVGVAGPHRLPERLAELENADAIVVVAGMEGALPSIVGGHVPCPVIGVPTSVGYGANFGGLSALLSMLNSCAANVTVVNIDAGFKAGYVAGLIGSRNAANDQRAEQ